MRGIQQLLVGLVVAVSVASITVGCTNAEIGKSLDLGLGYNQGYAPEQPIPFDHKLHAGKLKMECKYCHSQAERAKHAGAPSLNVCWNCHNQVKGLLVDDPKNPGEKTQTRSEHIAKLSKLMDDTESDQSIEWVRIHQLPDHARFNHAPHVKRGVSCQTCHGPIEEMTKVYQFSTLSMGWCVNCHRENETGVQGPLNCSTCHY